MRRSPWGRPLLALVILLAVLALWRSPWREQLTLPALKANLEAGRAAIEARPLEAGLTYVGVYALTTALSIPGAAVLTLAAGALFDLFWGTLLALTGATLGATGAFLAARYLFRDWVRARFRERAERVDAAFRREGAAYLLTLRLVPAFPFVLVNLLMGLTSIGTGVYAAVSLFGMLPASVIYVNAGRHLGEIESLRDVLTPEVWLSFAALAAAPWLIGVTVRALADRRSLRGLKRPRRFDYDVVVVGAGSAGLVAANLAASLRARVALVERHRMGGDCLNTGCVPSKALLAAAHEVRTAREAGRWGLRVEGEPDFAKVMAHVRAAIAAIAPNDSEERYRGLGVDVVRGEARLRSPWVVQAGQRELTTRAVVLATGAEPVLPGLPGIDAVAPRTSDTIWDLPALPRRLLVLGGGAIGCELGQAFARLGSRVTLVEREPQLLPREDADVAAAIAEALREDGVELRLGAEVARFEGGAVRAAILADGARIEFDEVLVALGRRPRIDGLRELGFRFDGDRLEVDECLRATFPDVYACGDLAGPWRLTHAAGQQGVTAALNALFGRIRRSRFDGSLMPYAVFTSPELGRVGLSEREAAERGLEVEVTRLELTHSDRAIAEGATRGFVKLLTARGSDRILGAHLVGARAGDLVAEVTLAMRAGQGLNALLATIHAYPTHAETVRLAAGRWRRAHQPEWALGLLGRWFAFRRG